MSDREKPMCGSGKDIGEYDFPLHVAAVFIVFFASVAGAGFPVVAKRVRWMKIPRKVFFFCKHFGTGVLIATAFVHLLPTAFASLNDPCLPDLFTDKFPAMPGVIMMGSLFILFVIEMWLNAVTGGHSHGGATGNEFAGGPQPPDIQAALDNLLHKTDSNDSQKTILTMREDKMGWVEKTHAAKKFEFSNNDELDPQSEMPLWFVVFYEQYVRQREEMAEMVSRARPATPWKSQEVIGDVESCSDEDIVDAASLRKQSFQLHLIEGGIFLHSLFVGMTFSITSGGFLILFFAIVFHQMFEGLGLGSRIAAVPYPRNSWRPWVLVVAFGSTAPIGQAIGLFARGSYDPTSAYGLIIMGVCNAVSSGLLIYAALVDLLAEDFLSEQASRNMTGKDKAIAFLFVVLGAAGMSVIGAFA